MLFIKRVVKGNACDEKHFQAAVYCIIIYTENSNCIFLLPTAIASCRYTTPDQE
jgi:hypothetical protein